MPKNADKLPPVHPGTLLKEEFLLPLTLSANQLSLHLHVPAGRIAQIVKGQRGITANTALRLARYFGTSPEFWLNLQQRYELQCAEDEIADLIEVEVRPMKKQA